MAIDKCPIWGTPAVVEKRDGQDGCMVDSPRAGGKYFVVGTVKPKLEDCDDRLKACLTSWLVEKRHLGIACPEIDSRTISEAQQRKPLGIPERANGILLYLETRSDHLGDEVTYRVFLDLYAESIPTGPEREYFGLLSHSESINKKELFFLLDYLDQRALIENITSDDWSGGCILTADGYARLKAVGYQYGQATHPFPSNDEWDVFISHASEDKDDFVRPLAEGLEQHGLRVWFDESTLKVGDSLRRSIDRGLGHSKFGIVVISKHFLNKEWPQRELDGLASRENDGVKVILPIWHNIDAAAVREASPMLADRVAISSSENLERVIEDLMQVIAAPATESRPSASIGGPEKKRTGSGPDAVIRAWWKKGALGVGLVAALTTALVNLQVIKGWFTADSRSIVGTADDRTSPVQPDPSLNKDVAERAAPERLPTGPQTKFPDKVKPDLQTGPPASTQSRTAAPADASPVVSRQPAVDTGGPSGDLAELATQIRKEVEILAKPGEKWQVSDGPRISVTLFNPRNPTSGRGHEINASNRDDLESVMESLRAVWVDRHRKDDEYKRSLLKQ